MEACFCYEKNVKKNLRIFSILRKKSEGVAKIRKV